MDNNKFLICVIAMGLTTISIMAICIAIYNIKENSAIVDMVKNGSPPIEAMCAIKDNFGDNPNCIIFSSKKNQEK